MTHHTDAERALSNLRHLYSQMTGGLVKDSAQAKRIAEGLLSPAIARLEQAARRAPAAPVPQYEPVAYLWQHCETGRTRVVMPDMVITADANWIVVGPLYLAAAPQPPEVAPVPQFSRIAQKKLDYLLEAGEAITGYAIENKDGRRGAIDCHGFVYWWQDAAAPQQLANHDIQERST